MSDKKMVFVFGSNEAGIHGAGAAAYAHKQEGAVWGKGVGHYGNSYAIPTKDLKIQTLGLRTINVYVMNFIEYARKHPELEFKVTQIGCGLAGLRPKDIAPMFKDAPSNCLFDTDWKLWLGDTARYWGHM